MALDVERGPSSAMRCSAWSASHALGAARYAVTRVIVEHDDAKLGDLLTVLINCPKANAASIYDRCEARFNETHVTSET